MLVKEKQINLTLNQKALVILAFVFIFLMLFLPLWQIGRNRSLDMEIESQRKKMLALEEEERVIKANIATNIARIASTRINIFLSFFITLSLVLPYRLFLLYQINIPFPESFCFPLYMESLECKSKWSFLRLVHFLHEYHILFQKESECGY